MIRSPTKVICDAGPIIHLDEIKCLNLLHDFKEIILPFSVEREIAVHRPSALTASNLTVKRQAESLDIGEKLHALCQIFSLDAGEIESLVLMQSHPTAIFLTDDAAARLAAEQMRFKVHGTIGILLRSIRRGQKKPEEVFQILVDIPKKSTLYISNRHFLMKYYKRLSRSFSYETEPNFKIFSPLGDAHKKINIIVKMLLFKLYFKVIMEIRSSVSVRKVCSLF